MSIGLGLRKRDFDLIAGVPRGVEHSKLFYIEGYAANPVFGMRHYYNGEQIGGLNFAKPGDTWEYEVYGDIAYIQVVFTHGTTRHCSYIVCTKEYYTEGRSIESHWVHQDSGAHETLQPSRCGHASNWNYKGLVSWKP